MIRLQQLRLDALLTVRELAERTGVSFHTIYRLEAGKPAQIRTLARLSTYFDVPASELLRTVEDLERAA